jgi:hypothetical protein
VPSVEELRANRPTEPGFARVLLIIAVVLWLPVAGNVYYSGAGLVAVALFLVVFGAFGTVKGRQAGRIMTTIALGVTYVFMAPYCLYGFRDDTNPYGAVYAMIDIIAVLLSVAALTQLYHSNTNRYVHMVTAAMRE